MLGDKPDGGVVWSNLGSDNPFQAADQIASFAETAASAEGAYRTAPL